MTLHTAIIGVGVGLVFVFVVSICASAYALTHPRRFLDDDEPDDDKPDEYQQDRYDNLMRWWNGRA